MPLTRRDLFRFGAAAVAAPALTKVAAAMPAVTAGEVAPVLAAREDVISTGLPQATWRLLNGGVRVYEDWARTITEDNEILLDALGYAER